VVSAAARRSARAAGVTLLTLPCVLVAHLITTGAVVSPIRAACCLLAVAVVAVGVPARTPAGLGLLAGGAQLVGHTVLALLPGGATGSPDCLRVIGRGAELGLRLAVFRHDPGCPTGTLAPGTSLTAAVIAMLVAAAVVAGHAAATGLLLAGARALEALAAVAGAMTVARLASALLAVLTGRRLPARPEPVRQRPAWLPHLRITRSLFSPAPDHRRGPPVATA
jgi:hypothetical protein